jgi:hypothetical protein
MGIGAQAQRIALSDGERVAWQVELSSFSNGTSTARHRMWWWLGRTFDGL